MSTVSNPEVLLMLPVFSLALIENSTTGLIRQPKWGHLKELHEAVKLCSETILSVFPSIQSLGEQQEVNTPRVHQ